MARPVFDGLPVQTSGSIGLRMKSDRIEVCVVVGTRPEIIKMAPVIRQLQDFSPFALHLVHTDQHYDDELSDVFFQNLDLPPPDEHLEVGSGHQAAQTARGLEGIASCLRERKPDVVLAQGDTNAVLSTALAASKLSVEFGHVEAGIRSFDRSMPEEINRLVADVVADILFAPTEDAEANLEVEGIESAVHITGNTIVDACHRHATIADTRSTVHRDFGLDPDRYILVTIHRPRNTDDATRLSQILEALDSAPFPVLLPAHPRTRNAMASLEENYPGITVIEPLDYLDFLALERSARVIVTDSGGIQEEASILEVPCLTVRPNTERPETIAAGVNKLVEPDELADVLRVLCDHASIRESMRGHPNLYGDGRAGERIVTSLAERLDISTEIPEGDVY